MQIRGEKYRITCLSDSLIRFEWDEKGRFLTDRRSALSTERFLKCRAYPLQKMKKFLLIVRAHFYRAYTQIVSAYRNVCIEIERNYPILPELLETPKAC